MPSRRRSIPVLGVAPLLLSIVALGGDAGAQPGSGRAAIAGVVYDSLVTNAPLAGAEVSVEGSHLAAITDGAGRFRLDGVPAGRVVLRFYHRTLDSLGFGAAPVAVAVGDSGVVRVRLATPAPATLHARLCPRPQPASTGALLGRVSDVDDHGTLPGAQVIVSWSEWTVGAGGLVKNDGRAAAGADATGAFALCGVPTDVAVTARATAAGHLTGFVEVDFAQRAFAVRDFAVSVRDAGASTERLAQLDSAVARGDSVVGDGTVTLTGTVRGSDGRPLEQAQVALLGFPIAVRTTSEGGYSLAGVPAGTQTIEVRAVGFSPQRLTVALRTGERRTADVRLDRGAQTLALVNIVGHGARRDMTGFENRRKGGIGYFMGPEEVERRRAFDTSQLFWGIPGVRVVWDGAKNVITLARPRMSGAGGGRYNNICKPAVFADGFLLAEIDDVRPYMIRGVEVYRDRSAAPAEFRLALPKPEGTPDATCGVILIWTKPPEPRPPKDKARP